MTVSFQELSGSPMEEYSTEHGMRAERRILTAWDDRTAMLTELMGNGFASGGNAGAAYPGNAQAVVSRAKVVPFIKQADNSPSFNDVAVDLNSYSVGDKLAFITVNYEMRQVSGLPQPVTHPLGTYLTYRMDFAGAYRDTATHSLKWESNQTYPVPPDVDDAIRIPLTEHHLSWHRVLLPPWAAIRSHRGKVNSAAWAGFPAETLLFDGATADRSFTGFDELETPQFGYRIDYVFREKAVVESGVTYGWQHTWRSQPSNSAGWDKLVDIGSGREPYQTVVGFDGLFVVPDE